MEIRNLMLGNNIATPVIKPLSFNDEILFSPDYVSLGNSSSITIDPFIMEVGKLRNMASPFSYSYVPEFSEIDTAGMIGSNDPLAEALELQKYVADTLIQKQLERNNAIRENQMQERKEKRDEEAQRDLQELRRLQDGFDNMWNSDLGGSSGVELGAKSGRKLADMEYQKNSAISSHDRTIDGLESEKGSLESELASATDETAKQTIREKIQEVEAKIQAEKVKKEETQRLEEEKIKQKKEKFQQLSDKLYNVREEIRNHKMNLENAGSYEDSFSQKSTVQWRLYELQYEESKIREEINQLAYYS